MNEIIKDSITIAVMVVIFTFVIIGINFQGNEMYDLQNANRHLTSDCARQGRKINTLTKELKVSRDIIMEKDSVISAYWYACKDKDEEIRKLRNEK